MMKMTGKLATLGVFVFLFWSQVTKMDTSSSASSSCDLDLFALLKYDAHNRLSNKSSAFAIVNLYDYRLIQTYCGDLYTFDVPSDDCPSRLVIDVLNELNNQRLKDCMPPLYITNSAMCAAQNWASSNSKNLNQLHQPSNPKFGQLAWRDNTEVFALTVKYGLKSMFDDAVNDVFRKKTNAPWGAKARPLFNKGEKDKDGSYKWRTFTDEEWAATRGFGLGCSVFTKTEKDGKKWTLFHVAAFFNIPEYNKCPY